MLHGRETTAAVGTCLDGALRQEQAHVALAAEQGLLHPLRGGVEREVGHRKHLRTLANQKLRGRFVQSPYDQVLRRRDTLTLSNVLLGWILLS